MSSGAGLMKRRHICVSVATRNRPKMLCNLFSSLSLMRQLEDDHVSFLIVENSSSKTLDHIVHQFRADMPGSKIEYHNEGTAGISAVRNFALNHAITQGYDLLVFVDDDETVDTNWLVNLLAERDRSDFDIVGSPVRPMPYQEDLTFMQKLVWSGIERSGLKSERKCKLKCASGKAHSIKIATGSWMGKLSFFRETELRFDQKLGLTGGEDWNLWLKAKELGAKTGWASDAIAYETVPASRLTLSYHFRRNRDHNITEFTARYRENPKKALKKLPMKFLGRGFKVIGAICSTPFLGGRGLISTATALGGFVGLIQACYGRSSLHYAETTGY